LTESAEKALQVVCPTCRAAIGAKCSKPVQFGFNFINEFHESRIALSKEKQ
jgi:hypothetical protein